MKEGNGATGLEPRLPGKSFIGLLIHHPPKVAVFFIVVGICLAITATESNQDGGDISVGDMARQISSNKAKVGDFWCVLFLLLL